MQVPVGVEGLVGAWIPALTLAPFCCICLGKSRPPDPQLLPHLHTRAPGGLTPGAVRTWEVLPHPAQHRPTQSQGENCCRITNNSGRVTAQGQLSR